jgi:hypothetical protein
MEGLMRDLLQSSGASSSGGLSEAARAVEAALGGAAGGDEMAENRRKASEIWTYLEELSKKDPKAYSEFLQKQALENARMEAQEAMDEAVGRKPGVFPTPGFVLKLTTKPEAGEGGSRKTFLNVVSHAVVQPPTLPSGAPAVDKAGVEHPDATAQCRHSTVPLALGHVRGTPDNKGETALVVDVLAHPWCMAQADKDAAFRAELISLVTSSALSELHWSLDRGAGAKPVEIRASYKGGMRVPGSKDLNDIVPAKFLIHDKDRPKAVTHQDCAPSALPEAEAKRRVAASTAQAMRFAASAVEAMPEDASAASEATARAAAVAVDKTMRTPQELLRGVRGETSGRERETPSTVASPLIQEVSTGSSISTVASPLIQEVSTGSSISTAEPPRPKDEAVRVELPTPKAGGKEVTLLVRNPPGGCHTIRVFVRPKNRVALEMRADSKPLLVRVPDEDLEVAWGGAGCMMDEESVRVVRSAKTGALRVRIGLKALTH